MSLYLSYSIIYVVQTNASCPYLQHHVHHCPTIGSTTAHDRKRFVIIFYFVLVDAKFPHHIYMLDKSVKKEGPIVDDKSSSILAT